MASRSSSLTQVRLVGEKNDRSERGDHAFFELHDQGTGNPVAFPGHLNWGAAAGYGIGSQPAQPHPPAGSIGQWL